MEAKKARKGYSPEVGARAVRRVTEHAAEHASQWAAIRPIAAKIGCSGETLGHRVRRAERDPGVRPGVTTEERERMKARARGPRAPPGERDPAKGFGVFCAGGARPPVRTTIAFIDGRRAVHGVEPICKVLPVAPSTHRAHAARRADPAGAPPRARRDVAPKERIRRVREENVSVHGGRKVRRRLKREGVDAARCIVARLMREMGLKGVVRGKSVRTTIGDRSAPCPPDRVNRRFQAPRPDALRVSDLTCVATWQGFVCVAPRH